MTDVFDQLTVAERTDKGRVRETNEDAILSLPRAGLFAVADGMGGAREGEVAARAVMDQLRDTCAEPALPLIARIRRCRDACNEASLWIRQYAARQGNPGMGTTVVVLLFDPLDPARGAVLHAGDSRLYRLRAGVLEQLTRDHSVAALAGVEHEGHVPAMFRSVITRAVGVRRKVELEITSFEVQNGDLFLICTDGLYNLVPRDVLAQILNSPRDLDHKAVALIEAALHGGGDDNVTVLLVRAGNAGQDGPVTMGAEGVQLPACSIPEPAFDAPRRRGPQGPLMSLLTIALLGIAGVWFAFRPFPSPGNQPVKLPERLVAQPVSVAVPVSEEVSVPAPLVEELPAVSLEVVWQTEREGVAADPDRVKVRHAAVLAAFARLSAWSGKVVVPPSYMMAGAPEDRPEAWSRYLVRAQEQWRKAGVAECARMRAESSCLSTARLEWLWRWEHVPGSGSTSNSVLVATADWTAWAGELDRMEQFLRAEPGAGPFLYALPANLFTPGRNAADLGDRAWDGVLPLVNSVWKRRDYWLARAGEAGTAPVEEAIRRANAIWAGYNEAGYATRPWRQAMNPDEVTAFFEALNPDRFSGDVRQEPEGP